MLSKVIVRIIIEILFQIIDSDFQLGLVEPVEYKKMALEE